MDNLKLNDNNIVYSCKYHVVWCTKYRRKLLSEDIALRMKELIDEIAAEHPIEILDMDINPDYVHIRIEVDPCFGLHKAIKLLKGSTSRILRQEFLEISKRVPTLWTNSYFVATQEDYSLENINRYLQAQPKSQRQIESSKAAKMPKEHKKLSEKQITVNASFSI